jgi:MFS family permease
VSPENSGGRLLGTTLTLESIATIAALLCVQQLAHRVGTIRLYVWVKIGNLVVSLTVFALMANQRSAIPVLLFAAAMGGALQGLSITLVQRIMASYYPAGQTRAPAALLSAVFNSGAIAGAVLAGVFASRYGPVPMFAAYGLLGIPLILVLVLRPPGRKPTASSGSRPFAFLVALATKPSRMRDFFIAVFVGAITVAPFSHFLVPVSTCLCDVNTAQTPIFLVAVAVGAIATPAIVRALPENRDLDLVRWGYCCAGGVLVVAGLLGLTLSGVVGVVLLFPLVVVYSALMGAASSVAIAGVQAGSSDGDALQRVSVFFMATFLALAISGLSWGTVFDTFGGAATVIANGLACMALLTAQGAFLRRRANHPGVGASQTSR